MAENVDATIKALREQIKELTSAINKINLKNSKKKSLLSGFNPEVKEFHTLFEERQKLIAKLKGLGGNENENEYEEENEEGAKQAAIIEANAARVAAAAAKASTNENFFKKVPSGGAGSGKSQGGRRKTKRRSVRRRTVRRK